MKQNHFVSISKSFEDDNIPTFFLLLLPYKLQNQTNNNTKNRPILSKCSSLSQHIFTVEKKVNMQNIQKIERITNKICHNKVFTEQFSTRKCESVKESFSLCHSLLHCICWMKKKKKWPSFIFIGNASQGIKKKLSLMPI